jgi:hypothetical protein
VPRRPSILDEMARQQEREEQVKLRAMVDHLTYRLAQLTKGGRPGPNWDAYEEHIGTLIDHSVAYEAICEAMTRLILQNEAVRRSTVVERIREMMTKQIAQRKK